MSGWLYWSFVVFLCASAGLFWAGVAALVWEKTADRRTTLRKRIMGRNLSKLLALEGDLAKLRAQIERDFPGELAEYHPYDYGEQHVISTAAILLGRYYAYVGAGACCQKSSSKPTFAPFRMPSKQV